MRSPLTNAKAPGRDWERARLASLRELAPFMPPQDRAMESVAQEAGAVCEAPIAWVSVVDEHEERILAAVGLAPRTTPRRDSLGDHALGEEHALVVRDLSADARFRSLPCVAGDPSLRFYAGVPVLDATGLPLGALCIAHTEARDLSSACLLALGRLAEATSAVWESRLLLADAQSRHWSPGDAQATRSRLDALLLTLVAPRPTCA